MQQARVIFGGVGAMILVTMGCPSDTPSEDDGPCETGTGGPENAGEWDGDEEDWCDPGAAGNETLPSACGSPSQVAHHEFTTAVHAVHLHTGQVLLFHGERDERIWTIGTEPSEITWHPYPLQIQIPPPIDTIYFPDLFCSGHVQLEDGRVFLAGGNVTGSGAAGGLRDTFLFEPLNAQPASQMTCPFGWGLDLIDGVWENPAPMMTHGRWYPTLTTLGDGRVLISGGFSVEAFEGEGTPTGVRSRLLEVYDPGANSVTALVDAEFPDTAAAFPSYPLMFLLPNGDVFYAGSDDAQTMSEASGRILIPDYNNNGVWEWASHEITSSITGASAVMYEPGKILKTGGRDENTIDTPHQVNGAEIVDLSGIEANGYSNNDDVPDSFTDVTPMSFARHFHNMVILPNGRVMAVGGNRRGNSGSRDHYSLPCEWEGERIDEIDCEDGCPSICYDDVIGVAACFEEEDEPPSLGLRCSGIDYVLCGDASTPEAADELCDAALPGATCGGTVCERSCNESGELCGMIQDCAVTSSSPDDDKCGVFNNECYATKSAEIWDPKYPNCDAWTEVGEQESPRLYHSTALLLPDGRVLSMGGGHRDFGAWSSLAEYPVSEYFAPQYATDPEAPRPAVSLVSTSDPDATDIYLPWNGWVRVSSGGRAAPTRATLIRLGATTHGFDQDQRFVELELEDEGGGTYLVYGPSSSDTLQTVEAQHIAPPGYYMLFLLSDLGQPSVGAYIRVGAVGSTGAYPDVAPPPFTPLRRGP